MKIDMTFQYGASGKPMIVTVRSIGVHVTLTLETAGQRIALTGKPAELADLIGALELVSGSVRREYYEREES